MHFIRIWLGILLFIFFSPQELSAKIRILTFHYNRPDFLEFQYKVFKKFLLDDYEVIVFNDAPDTNNEKSIQDMCKKYGWQCVRYEPFWHMINPLNDEIRKLVDTPHKNSVFQFPLKGGYPDLKAIAQQCSVRHCHVIQYALDNFGYDHDDIVVIMDADVFPIKPFSIRALLTDSPIVGIDNHRYYLEKATNPLLLGIENDTHYLWVPFIAFDPKRLPHIEDLKFHVDLVDGVLSDSGAHSYYYLQDNPDVSYQLYPPCSDYDFYPWDFATFSKFGFNNRKITQVPWPNSLEFYVNYHLVHFVGGSAEFYEKYRFVHVTGELSADALAIKKHQAIYDLLHCVLEE